MNRPDDTSKNETGSKEGPTRTAELQNDRTHDSTVDTDGKNREAARLAGDGPIGPDEVITSNATLVNSVPETPDGLAGYDSRRSGGRRLLFALEAGYEVVDKGMTPPELPDDVAGQFVDPEGTGQRRNPGRMHYALNHLRPTRIVEFLRKP